MMYVLNRDIHIAIFSVHDIYIRFKRHLHIKIIWIKTIKYLKHFQKMVKYQIKLKSAKLIVLRLDLYIKASAYLPYSFALFT